jgi:antitoxin component of MazEF toxin-antitoxin module
MKIKLIRKLRKIGDSFGVTFPTKLIRKKGFIEGDSISITISSIDEQKIKNRALANLARETMKKNKVKSIIIKMKEPTRTKENQNESSKNFY